MEAAPADSARSRWSVVSSPPLGDRSRATGDGVPSGLHNIN